MPSILIVDDEPGVRSSLSGVLRDEGFEVEAAASGEECLERAARSTFDVIVLDVWLPGIDGLIHSADLSVKRIEHPEEIVKVGQEIEVVVASVDPKQHRIALHPAPTGEAANETPQRVQLHKTVKVVVVNVETGGLIVRVLGATGRNARGFISAAATGTPRGTELRKLFPPGKQLEAKVTEDRMALNDGHFFDGEGRKIKIEPIPDA